MKASPFNIIVVLGPTASGKTALAAKLAHTLRSAVISADSRQVYRGMDLGTGKDYAEYTVNGNVVPHYLIDVVKAGVHYDIDLYTRDFSKVFSMLSAEGMIPVLCGGSGLYLESVLRRFEFSSVPPNPELRERLEESSLRELRLIWDTLPAMPYKKVADTSTVKRLKRAIEICTYLSTHEHHPPSSPSLTPLVFGLDPPRDARRRMIEARLKQRLSSGLVQEVQTLIDNGVSPDRLILYGLEYKFITLYLLGQLSYNDMYTRLTIAIQQFAKRQMTFFRRMERNGLPIHWIDDDLSPERKLQMILEVCSAYPPDQDEFTGV